MKKGLLTFLRISVIFLIIIVVAIVSYKLLLPKSNEGETTSSNSTKYSTEVPNDTSSSAVADSIKSEEGNPTPEAPKATAEYEDIKDSEEEPVLPEVTAEPDMDPDTWDYLKGGDYNMIYTDKEETPEKMPYEIRVNKQMNCITVYKPDKKGKYTKAVKSFVCSAGSKTPLGTFKTSNKYYWKAMIHGVWAQYATRITGDILFHSVPYDTHEKNTLITNYYNQLGSTASAGCVRLCAADAQWIIQNCPAGTTVEIYNSSDPGPLGKPSPIRIPYDCKWDPTDPDTRNPWKSEKTVITGVEDRTVERGSAINFLDGVTAYDIFNHKMSGSSIKVSTDLDKKTPGKYKVKYSFTDSKGEKVKETAVFTVVDTTAPKISGVPAAYYTQNAEKITQESIFKMVSLTDNGYSLEKDSHMNVTGSSSSYTITATDDYGHTSSLTCKIIEDITEPEIKLEKPIDEPYSIAKKIDTKWAAKRIKKVSDDKAKLTTQDVKISVKPNGWGMKITYNLTDMAGNKTSVSETVDYETASIVIDNPNPVVYDITDKDELSDLIKVKSESTGKKISDYKVKISKDKLEGNELNKTYNVNYTVTYKSSAGSKTTTASIVVSVPRE